MSKASQNQADGEITLGTWIGLLDVLALAQPGTRARLDPAASQRLTKARTQLLDAVAGGATIYGVNTGFGALSETPIASDEIEPLQTNLIRSHAMGVGEALPVAVSRALLALRAHTISLGYSGASQELVLRLLELHAAGVTPLVPSQGSVGASGDLAPLAHLALPVIGEGEVLRGSGERISGAQALREAGIEPFVLGAKEGLSLINGTQVTAAIGAMATLEALELVRAADIIGAMSLDAHLGSSKVCDPRIHQGKPHYGQRRTAELIAGLVEGSPLNASHANCGRVQDAYCMRCMPQVHGAARDALLYVARVLEVEINSATDNPLVLARDDGGFDVLSGGNFHAGTIALPLDHAAAALTTLATISERRADRFLAPESSRGLPAFLAANPGLESGLMMIQVTAAALASECKALSHPACVDTIPTSAGKEDHVSMGPIAARKVKMIVDNVARVLAIEAIVAARALDLREHPTSSPLQRVHAAIRRHVAAHGGDRSYADEIDALASAIKAGELREAAGLAHEWTEYSSARH